MKKALSILLAVIMTFGSFTIAFGEIYEPEKINVEIATDKEEYGLTDKIFVKIKVTNISDEAIDTASLHINPMDFILISESKNSDKDRLMPGESIEKEITVKPHFEAKELKFSQKVILFFSSFTNIKSLINRYLYDHSAYSFSPDYDFGVANIEIPITVDGCTLTLGVTASYCIGEHN